MAERKVTASSSGPTIQQDYNTPDSFEGIGANLVMRGLNKIFGDPVQEVNTARAQVEAANEALQEGLTLQERGVDLAAIDKVLPGYSAALIGGEKLPSFQARRAFAQQIFAPQPGSQLAPPADKAGLAQQLVTQGAHTRSPFAGPIGQEPTPETITQRIQDSPPSQQEYQFGIPAIDEARVALGKANIRASEKQSRRSAIVNLVSSFQYGFPGASQPDLKNMAENIVTGKPLSPQAAALLTVGRGGGDGSDVNAIMDDIRQTYTGVVIPAFTDSAFENLSSKEREKLIKDKAGLASRNLKRVPQIINAAMMQLNAEARLSGRPPTREAFIRYIKDGVRFIDDDGNVVLMHQLPKDKAAAILGAIEAQLPGGEGEAPGTDLKTKKIAEGTGQGGVATPKPKSAVQPMPEKDRPRRSGERAPTPVRTPTRTPVRTEAVPTFVPSQRPGRY